MKISNRIFFDILLFISIAVFPWWVGTILAIWLFFVIIRYYELIFVGFLFDVLYGTGALYITLTASLLWLIFGWLEIHLRFYDQKKG